MGAHNEEIIKLLIYPTLTFDPPAAWLCCWTRKSTGARKSKAGGVYESKKADSFQLLAFHNGLAIEGKPVVYIDHQMGGLYL